LQEKLDAQPSDASAVGYEAWKMEWASLAHFRRFLAEPDMAERPIYAANA